MAAHLPDSDRGERRASSAGDGANLSVGARERSPIATAALTLEPLIARCAAGQRSLEVARDWRTVGGLAGSRIQRRCARFEACGVHAATRQGDLILALLFEPRPDACRLARGQHRAAASSVLRGEVVVARRDRGVGRASASGDIARGRVLFHVPAAANGAARQEQCETTRQRSFPGDAVHAYLAPPTLQGPPRMPVKVSCSGDVASDARVVECGHTRAVAPPSTARRPP